MNVVCFTYDTDPYAPWFNCSSHSTSRDLNPPFAVENMMPHDRSMGREMYIYPTSKTHKHINHSWIGKLPTGLVPWESYLWGFQVL